VRYYEYEIPIIIVGISGGYREGVLEEAELGKILC
jgi:hypothetical protein